VPVSAKYQLSRTGLAVLRSIASHHFPATPAAVGGISRTAPTPTTAGSVDSQIPVNALSGLSFDPELQPVDEASVAEALSYALSESPYARRQALTYASPASERVDLDAPRQSLSSASPAPSYRSMDTELVRLSEAERSFPSQLRAQDLFAGEGNDGVGEDAWVLELQQVTLTNALVIH
jgi:hypothetical protein